MKHTFLRNVPMKSIPNINEPGGQLNISILVILHNSLTAALQICLC